MPQQNLDQSDIHLLFQQVCRITVSEKQTAPYQPDAIQYRLYVFTERGAHEWMKHKQAN
jgi:hypothetical protein